MVRVSLVTADTAARMASGVWTHGGAGGLSSTNGWAVGPARQPGAGHSRLTAGQRCVGATTILAATRWPACRGEGRPSPRRPLPGPLGAS
jgi:hypothetical protein